MGNMCREENEGEGHEAWRGAKYKKKKKKEKGKKNSLRESRAGGSG